MWFGSKKTKHEKYRKGIGKYFKTPGKEIEVSEFEGFRLNVSSHETRKGCWSYTEGIVTRLSDNFIVADIKRNYATFWHTWVNHPNGKKYMLCGEDYQGYSIVNLTDGIYKVHFPEEGYEGHGFCWVSATPSPSGKLLAVEGCIWACPYEILILDFSEPDSLPYKSFSCLDALSGMKRWHNDDSIEIINELDIRKSDGKLWKDLTVEEYEEAFFKEDIDSREEIIIQPWRGDKK
jgi:hypothetical protein